MDPTLISSNYLLKYGYPHVARSLYDLNSVRLLQSVWSLRYTRHLVHTQWLFKLDTIFPTISPICLPVYNEKFYTKFAQFYSWFIKKFLRIMKIPKIYRKFSQKDKNFFGNFSKCDVIRQKVHKMVEEIIRNIEKKLSQLMQVKSSYDILNLWLWNFYFRENELRSCWC